MTTPEGAFCASLDADSEGEEGKFYVWSLARDRAGARRGGRRVLRAPLRRDGRRAISKATTSSIASRACRQREEEETRLAALRERLLAAREPRVRPGLDDKVLADWNGLMIAALANAGVAFGEPEWLAHGGARLHVHCRPA